MKKKHTPKAQKSAPKRRRAPVHPAFDEPPPIVGIQDLAKILGVSHDTIQTVWQKLPGAPEKMGNGRYHVAQWVAFAELVNAVTPRGLRAQAKYIAATGQVEPMPPPAAGASPTILSASAGAMGTEPSDASNTATTTAELIRLSPVDLDHMKNAEEVIKKRLANQERRGKLIPRAAVEEHLVSKASHAVSLARRLELELPPKIEGKTRPEIETTLREEFDGLLRSIAALGEPVKVAKEPPPQAAVTGGPEPPHDQQGQDRL